MVERLLCCLDCYRFIKLVLVGFFGAYMVNLEGMRSDVGFKDKYWIQYNNVIFTLFKVNSLNNGFNGKYWMQYYNLVATLFKLIAGILFELFFTKAISIL